jgi:hypothetical protein
LSKTTEDSFPKSNETYVDSDTESKDDIYSAYEDCDVCGRKRYKEENATIEELKEELSQPTTGLSFIEKLILCLIYAHPDNETRVDDYVRLKNILRNIDRKYVHNGESRGLYKNDLEILLWMAEQEHLYGVATLSKKNREICKYQDLTSLARSAIEKMKYKKHHNIESSIRRLTKKYLDTRNELIGSVIHENDVVHSLEFQILLRIKSELDLVNVPFEVRKSIFI